MASIDNYFLQLIDVLADHDRKYFAIFLFDVLLTVPPCPAISESGGARSPRSHGVGAPAYTSVLFFFTLFTTDNDVASLCDIVDVQKN